MGIVKNQNMSGMCDADLWDNVYYKLNGMYPHLTYISAFSLQYLAPQSWQNFPSPFGCPHFAQTGP